MKSFIEKLEALLEWGGVKKDIVLLALSGTALALSLAKVPGLPFDVAWISIVLCGLPILSEAFIGLVTAFDIKADVLVSMALIASVCIGEDFAAGEVAFIMQIGALLEDLTVARARAGIEKLVRLTPQTARIVTDGAERIIAAEDVRIGDILRVLPGESVPVDGVITAGTTSVDQAVLTGESMPVDKTVGDEVSSGTINRFGSFDMRAEKVGEDSSIQRMVALVQSTDAGKARIVGLADRWATWIVVSALTAAVVTWLVTGEIIRAVTILVVFCPCALVLATPTAIMAAIGNAARHGFLVREGDALERLASVKCVAFDKTGTLTCGTPGVTDVVTLGGIGREELFALAAAAEQMSEHPLGRAIVRSYGKAVETVSDFRMIPGEGVSAVVGGRLVRAGNLRLLGDCRDLSALGELAQPYLQAGSTVIYVAADDEALGCVVLADTVRDESAQTVSALRSLGIESVLLTGDHRSTAETIAGKLGISRVFAECLPEDKLRHIRELSEHGELTCMIGDGVNDAPALKLAHVGIAMGGIGSDIAVDASDIVLVDDELSELPHLAALSGRMMRTIRGNMIFSMGLNLAAVVLAMVGSLSPVLGALVHNAGSVLVIINSALLLRWKTAK